MVDPQRRQPGTGEPITVWGAELLVVDLPLIRPFTTSFGTTRTRQTLLVRLYTQDGLVGYGEAAALNDPFYRPETTGTCLHILRDYAVPLVLGKTVRSPAELATLLAPIRGHGFAKAGLECAFWHIAAQRDGRSLSALLGGTRSEIEVGESIGMHPTVEETCEEIATRLAEGYRRIKLKIAPGWDVHLVEAVRARFGDIVLMVDANAGYTLADTQHLKRLDAYDLLMIEQPLAFDDIVDHARLQQELATPICLDESISTPEDARRALDIGACRIINVKPGRVGGLCASLAIHHLCRERSVPLWVGGMLESGIGRAFNLAVASLPGFTLPADMSPAHVFYAEDLIEPTYEVSAQGTIAVPQEPGLGFAVCDDRIARYTAYRWSARE